MTIQLDREEIEIAVAIYLREYFDDCLSFDVGVTLDNDGLIIASASPVERKEVQS